MANQLQATVVNGDGSTYTESFSVNEIWVQESTGTGSVHALIWINQYVSYKVSETISALATLASSSMVQATVKRVNGGSVNYQALFPSSTSSIGVSTGTSGINSYILFNQVQYFCAETQSSLVTAANAGGGGSVTIYGPYASNAAAIADGKVAGDLYKTTTVGIDGIQPFLSVVV
jgi:hypothetical protein